MIFFVYIWNTYVLVQLIRFINLMKLYLKISLRISLCVDKYVIGDGVTGAITKELHMTYLDVVRGKVEQFKEWVTPIY